MAAPQASATPDHRTFQPREFWHALATLSAFKRLPVFPTRLRPSADERPRNDARERARRRRQAERGAMRG